MTALVRAAALTNFMEVARSVGLNPLALVRAAGLNQVLLSEPEQRIPVAAAVRLLEMAAQESGCIDFGLRMAESRQLSDFGVVSLLISHQRSLRDALAVTMQYRHLLNAGLAMQVEEAGDLVIIREEVMAQAHPRQAIELALGVLHRMCAALMGGRWAPRWVSFCHEAPADMALHRRVFACRVDFGREFNGIACKASDLDALNPGADPAMARYARQFVESLPPVHKPSTVLEARRAIYLMLPTGRATGEYVAQSLGMSVRSLQRQLDDADTTFTDLLAEVRSELVTRYLANPRHSLMEVSELLGYSNASSFTRWFRTQFGMAPQAWRKSTR